jgi:hypothetical protein
LERLKRIRDAQIEAYVRSVGRKNGKGLRLLSRFRRSRPRDDHPFDFRDRGEDVWAVLRY